MHAPDTSRSLGRRAFTAALVAAVVGAGAGCRGTGRNAPTPVVRTTLRVVNQGFLDRNVYVVRGGGRLRLGTVPGNATQVLTIPPAFVQAMEVLRFVADPIGRRGVAVTDEIMVTPGDEVVLTIPPG